MGAWDRYALHHTTLGNPMKEAGLLNMQQHIKFILNSNDPLLHEGVYTRAGKLTSKMPQTFLVI